VDQSLAHNGICLTVEEIVGDVYRVTAIAETLTKTNAGHWQAGQLVNLERAMQMNGRLDGHLVQGHVDAVGTCKSAEDQDGSWLYQFIFPASFASLVIEKGSITVNGVSLTAFNVTRNSFCVAIIPYTYEHTNLKEVKKDTTVNLEFDMVGKYIQRQILLNQPISV
jgi:riboflavin synthase